MAAAGASSAMARGSKPLSLSPAATVASHDTIAMSDSYIGNDWRKSMVAAFSYSAASAKAAGMIAGYKVDISSENTASAQISQIDSLILAHVSAIDIDSASPTALNPVIQRACSAGIVVVVFDSLASAPCEYNVQDPFIAWVKEEADIVMKAIHYRGNVILAQGIVGSGPNAVELAAQRAVIAKYPHVHIVALVDSENTASVMESAIAAVLPSLGPVAGVVTVTASIGALEAFKAAGRPLPAVAFDTSGETLDYWANALKTDPTFQATGLNADPGESAIALYESIMLLNHRTIGGKLISHNLLNFPLVTITNANRAAWSKVTPVGTEASFVWTPAEVQTVIAEQMTGRPIVAPPVPTVAVVK